MKYVLALASFTFSLALLALLIFGYSQEADTLKLGALIFGTVILGIVFPWVLLTSGKRQ